MGRYARASCVLWQAGPIAACLAMTACGGSSDSRSQSTGPEALAASDLSSWREVSADNTLQGGLAVMCAGALDGLQAADPSLRDKVALGLPWSVEVSRSGKLQARCAWDGPSQRTGWVVVDVLCSDADRDACSRFAYGVEGNRHIAAAVPSLGRPLPLPVSTRYPPGRDESERARSTEILAWTRQNAADQVNALRVEFQDVRVGIVASAGVPFVCGQLREPGKPLRRFWVFSIGAVATPPQPSFYWRSEPGDRRAVTDACNASAPDLQWYAVPQAKMSP